MAEEKNTTKKKNMISTQEAARLSQAKLAEPGELPAEAYRDIRTIAKDTQHRVDELEKRVEKATTSFVETLGIFVALFTFISVDIQVFKSPLRILSVAGFTLIMLGSLLWFLFYFHAFLYGQIKFRKLETTEAPFLKSLKRVAASVSGATTEEIPLSWHPKTWPNGIWLQIISGALIISGVFCVGVDYTHYKPIYFDECTESTKQLSEQCLERQDNFEKEYVRNEKFEALQNVVGDELVKKEDIGYLGRLYNCLKKRRYWQYEQCFIE